MKSDGYVKQRREAVTGSGPGRESCRIAPEKEEQGFSLRDLDRLDLFSIAAVAALAAVLAVILWLAPPQEEKGAGRGRVQVVVVNPELDRRIEAAERVLASDNPAAARELLAYLKKNFSYDGRVFMLLGDYELRMQRPVAAMHYYRQAVDLNPDFLDRKTGLFQGKKIKGVLAEVAGIVAKRPDPAVRRELLYMQRKVAGGCGG